MSDHQQVRQLYAYLQELPRGRREQLLTEEWGVAAGREPDGDTERANWYRCALQRLHMPSVAKAARGRRKVPSLEEALAQVREEVQAREKEEAEKVGVVG